MSEPTRGNQIATWVILAILVVLLAIILVCGPLFRDPNANFQPTPPATVPYPKILPQSELRKIAIAEVKKREGWSGEADASYQEGVRFYVTVKSQARGKRVVVVEGTEGMVLEYRP
jgi:hypothetical protein